MRPVLITFILLIVGGLMLYWLRGSDVAAVREHLGSEDDLVRVAPPMPTRIVIANGPGRSKAVAVAPAKAKEPPQPASETKTNAEPPKADDFYRVERTTRNTYRWEVWGTDWKKDEGAAVENALDTARSFLAVQLRELRPESQYLPSRSDIQRLLRGKATLERKDFEGLGQLNQAKLEFELSAADYGRFFNKLRLEESAQREWLFTKGLLGVLALLGAVAGYFRFDEQTKGYYTGWLRVGAVAFLAAAGVGISLLP